MIRLHLLAIAREKREALRACGSESNGVVTIDENSECYQRIIQARIERRGENPDATKTTGVGTEVQRILKSLGVTDKEGCGCANVAARWDRLGVEWCRQHTDELAGYLVGQAKARGWLMGVAAQLTAPEIVHRAITAAEATHSSGSIA